MDALEKALTPIFGAVTPWLLVGSLVLIWVVKSLPGWLSANEGTLRGSPASSKYWRARLAEALSQQKDIQDAAERAELTARVRDARIMVEAHEAVRRLRISRGRQYWALVAVFGLFAVAAWASAASQSSPLGYISGILFALLMILAELAALFTASAAQDRFNVLVAAGRYGRSDLVREDPWRVLREYDYARNSAGITERRKDRTDQDKQRTTRWTRVTRSLLGLSAWQNDLILAPSQIWSPPEAVTSPSASGASGTPEGADR